MIIRTLMVVAGAAALMAGCARPADRITTTLTSYGMPEPQAVCVGERLGRDLSISQLRELSSLVRAYRENDPSPGRLTVQDFVRVSSQVRDPQVPVAVGRAALNCRLLY